MKTSFTNRFIGPISQVAMDLECYVSVKGTDCPIQELTRFRFSFYSEKLNGPGLRYEVGVSISPSRIVSVSGPFKLGEINDFSGFRETIKPHLQCGERVVTDCGYPDENVFNHPFLLQYLRMSTIRPGV